MLSKKERLAWLKEQADKAHTDYMRSKQDLRDALCGYIRETTGIGVGAIVQDPRGIVYKVERVQPSLWTLGELEMATGFKKTVRGWHKRATYVGLGRSIKLLAKNEAAYVEQQQKEQRQS